MGRNVLKDWLTKRRTRSACRRCFEKRCKGRQRSCVLVDREVQTARKEEILAFNEKKVCKAPTERRWGAFSGCGGPSTAASMASLYGEGQLDERRGVAR